MVSPNVCQRPDFHWSRSLGASAVTGNNLMLYKTLSAAVYGIDASIIEVEVDVSSIKTNENHSHTVGLPDAAVRESRDRVRSALRNCGYDIPTTHITINLASADIRKEGSGFDLPMALALVGAYGGLNKKEVSDAPTGREAAQECSPRRQPWVANRKNVKPQRVDRVHASHVPRATPPARSKGISTPHPD
jgi:Subunit ChlI of Mg-chelatase